MYLTCIQSALRIIQVNYDGKNDVTVSSSKLAVFKSIVSHRTFGLHSNLDFLSMFYIRSGVEPKVNINNGDRIRTQVPLATLIDTDELVLPNCVNDQLPHKQHRKCMKIRKTCK